MSCWKWFNIILERAGVEVTEENRDRVDAAIQEYVNARSSMGLCSAALKEASSEIGDDPTMRNELITKVREAAKPAELIRK